MLLKYVNLCTGRHMIFPGNSSLHVILSPTSCLVLLQELFPLTKICPQNFTSIAKCECRHSWGKLMSARLPVVVFCPGSFKHSLFDATEIESLASGDLGFNLLWHSFLNSDSVVMFPTFICSVSFPSWAKWSSLKGSFKNILGKKTWHWIWDHFQGNYCLGGLTLWAYTNAPSDSCDCSPGCSICL